MSDEGFMAEARANTMQQQREEVHAALQYTARFHWLVKEWEDCDELKPEPKEKWTFVDQKKEETKHRAEWCSEANKHRCMSCGSGSKCTKMPGKSTGPILCQNVLETGESVTLEVMIWSEEWIDKGRS